MKRSSARFFSSTTLTPFPDQYLKSTTHSHRNRGLWEARLVLPSPSPPSACYQIRNPTRDNPSLTSGSKIFLLTLPFSSLLTSSLSVNRDAPRYHPRHTVWEKKTQSPFPLTSPSSSSIWACITQFFYSSFYRRVCSSTFTFLKSSLFFYLSQIITLAKMSRGVLLSHAVWTHALSWYITSRHVTLYPITSYHGKQRDGVDLL